MAPLPVPASRLAHRDLTPDERVGVGPYGAQALIYFRDHCPRAFATIRDPLAYFKELGELIAGQIQLVEHAAAIEAWGDRDDSRATREARRRAAERQVFLEMLYGPCTPEAEAPDRATDPYEDLYQQYLEILEDRCNREVQ